MAAFVPLLVSAPRLKELASLWIPCFRRRRRLVFHSSRFWSAEVYGKSAVLPSSILRVKTAGCSKSFQDRYRPKTRRYISSLLFQSQFREKLSVSQPDFWVVKNRIWNLRPSNKSKRFLISICIQLHSFIVSHWLINSHQVVESRVCKTRFTDFKRCYFLLDFPLGSVAVLPNGDNFLYYLVRNPTRAFLCHSCFSKQ